jgi:hypothetical protein
MSNGLVEEIQKAAIDPNAKVSTLLRQVKLAAVKLKLDSVADWVEGELTGHRELKTFDVVNHSRNGFPSSFLQSETGLNLVEVGEVGI